VAVGAFDRRHQRKLENALEVTPSIIARRGDAPQEKRNALAKAVQAILKHHQEGQQAMRNPFADVEGNLALAKYAEGESEKRWTRNHKKLSFGRPNALRPKCRPTTLHEA
jgi:hypothetical protein